MGHLPWGKQQLPAHPHICAHIQPSSIQLFLGTSSMRAQHTQAQPCTHHWAMAATSTGTSRVCLVHVCAARSHLTSTTPGTHIPAAPTLGSGAALFDSPQIPTAFPADPSLSSSRREMQVSWGQHLKEAPHCSSSSGSPCTQCSPCRGGMVEDVEQRRCSRCPHAVSSCRQPQARWLGSFLGLHSAKAACAVSPSPWGGLLIFAL